MSISSASELELSLISLAGSDSTLTEQEGDKRKRKWREGWGGGGVGDYSREAIKNEGRLLFEEIRYSYTGTHSKASCHPKSVHPLDRFPVLVILLVKAAAKAIP